MEFEAQALERVVERMDSRTELHARIGRLFFRARRIVKIEFGIEFRIIVHLLNKFRISNSEFRISNFAFKI